MRKSTRWLALVSISALVALSLLGGIVSALAGSGATTAAAGVDTLDGGTEEAVALALAAGEAEGALAPKGEGDAPQEGMSRGDAKIRTIVFLDENENGEMDEGEAGLAGVTVKLNDGDDRVSESDGEIIYDGLDPGVYTLSETAPAGYRPTTQTSYTLDIDGNDNITVYFGNAAEGVLAGSVSDGVVEEAGGGKADLQSSTSSCGDGVIEALVKVDENRNGVIDDGDTLLDGVTVKLSHVNADGTHTPVSPASLTTGPGCGIDVLFFFWWVEVCYPGGHTIWKDLERSWEGEDFAWYLLSIEAPEGYTLVEPASGEYLLPLRCSLPCWWYRKEFLVSRDVQELKGSISGHKYNDADGSGDYSSGDLPRAGVAIELWKDGARLAETTTAADGSYSFANLAPGCYNVQEIVPAETEATSPTSVEVNLAAGQDVTGVDFFNRDLTPPPPPCGDGVIEALVKVDENCNGVIDDGDTLLDGVTVKLSHVNADGTHTPVSPASLTTGPGCGIDVLFFFWWVEVCYPGGHTIWKDLERSWEGEDFAWYLLSIEAPEGYTLVEPASGEYLLPLRCSLPCWWYRKEFLVSRNSQLSGHKYEDVNRNGVFDASIDLPLEGWTIELYDEEGAFLASTTTNAAGEYAFDNLPEGVYTVKEVLQPGWRYAYPLDGIFADVPVGCGDVTGKDFLNARYLSISGHKYEDADCDGEIGAEDPGLPGVEVQLFKWNESSSAYEFAASTVTGAGGFYEFTGLEPGTYKVQEVLTAAQLEDWFMVSPAGGAHEGAVLACADLKDLDFLNARYGALEGWKYWDKNENGIMDGDDEGLVGVTIILDPDPALGMPQATTVTGAEGYFFFGHLLPGKYTVSVDESTAPDYYPVGPVSIEVDVTCGQTAKVYFSEAPYGSISGIKWLDTDYDGIRGESEEGIGGIAIELWKDGVMVAETTTDDKDGSYQFTDLRPGEYTVIEKGKAGYFSTTPDSVVVILSPGEGAVIDFGNCPYGEIEGLKFIDLNGNGLLDPGEPNGEGVEITLEGLGGIGAIAVATTGEDGTFSFKDLLPGSYAVSETVPADHYATRPIRVELLVGPGEIASVIFANAPYSEIGGIKYIDDGDEILDPDTDRPLEGMTITLKGETAGGELVSQEAKTLADGSYAFLLLEAGEYTVAEIYDAEKMQAIWPDSVDLTLSPGEQAVADFLNVEVEIGGEVIEPPSTTAPDRLPHTGMDQMPIIISAAALTFLGLVFLALGLRRRYQE